MHNYFIKVCITTIFGVIYVPTCFDTLVLSSGSLQGIHCNSLMKARSVETCRSIDYTKIISSTKFNAQFLFVNSMFVTLLSSTCFEH